MLELTTKNCTGCSACANICPKNAISMQENSEGFLYPRIDTSKCTKCGLCEKICPTQKPSYKNSEKPECYAVMAKDEIRIKSSSGGVFPVLADYILHQGGYVSGAIWENCKVKHIVSNKIEDIERMRSSKYIQSSLGNCYNEIKGLLEENNMVLFTGTPCQIAGLYAFLRKNYDNLYTAEIICHGTPSPKVFKKYLEETLNQEEEFVETNFRDKERGWSTSTHTVKTLTNKNSYKNFASDDDFMLSFLNNICLRASCSSCNFNKLPRQADITMGDFWKIDKYNKKYNDKKGTSVVLVNNLKGQQLLKNIQKEVKLLKKVPLKYAIKGNPNLIRPSKQNSLRERFFNELEYNSLANTVQNHIKNDCDYLLVNLWDSNNYGALLTAYAMQELIRGFGFTTKYLDSGERTTLFRNKNSFGKDFINKFLYKTSVLNFKQANKLTKNIKGVILGSDQVLRIAYIKQAFNKYLLNFVDNGCKKIALSASFGLDKEDLTKDKFSTRKNLLKMKEELKTFDYLSCRELSGVDIYKEIFGLNSSQILDPVFLISKEKYETILSNATESYDNKFISYVLDTNSEYKKVYNEISTKYNSELIDLYNTENPPSVYNFLNAIKNCKGLITDSFHGVCFALIFNKPFIAIKNNSRGRSRFDSLCKMFNIEDSFVDSIEKLTEIGNVEIDYKNINTILENETKRCLEEIKKVLFENYSNNTDKQLQLKKSTKKKYSTYLKIYSYKLQSKIFKKKKEKYLDKITSLKHKLDWN